MGTQARRRRRQDLRDEDAERTTGVCPGAVATVSRRPRVCVCVCVSERLSDWHQSRLAARPCAPIRDRSSSSVRLQPTERPTGESLVVERLHTHGRTHAALLGSV